MKLSLFMETPQQFGVFAPPASSALDALAASTPADLPRSRR
jgi:hypothetical protein